MDMAAPPYYGLKLTLTAQSTNYNLLALIRATSGYETVPNYGREIKIRAGATAIQMGGADLGAANEGDTLPVNAQKTYGPYTTPCFPLSGLNLRCNTAAGATFELEVISAA